jgi:hypothetical protein
MKFLWKIVERISTKMSSGNAQFPGYALRNRPHILKVIQEHVFQDASCEKQVLSLAEGSGCHTDLFAAAFKNCTFQPSEYEAEQLETLDKNLSHLLNANSAVQIDTSKPDTWNVEKESLDLVTCINMIHISPFECTVGLMKGCGEVLRQNGYLLTYGPYSVDRILSPESNENFNKSLKERNGLWGIRDIADVEKEAVANGLVLKERLQMPANNFCLLFQKQ